MATRSTIGIILNDGTVKAVYCHFDGYLSGVGKTLLEHYNTYDKVLELFELGSISVLEENAKTDSLSHSFQHPLAGVTIAYHRDRGEDLHIYKYCCIEEYLLMKSHKEEYNYLFKDGVWICSLNDTNVYKEF